jgi:hypothetical protein
MRQLFVDGAGGGAGAVSDKGPSLEEALMFTSPQPTVVRQ